MTALEDRCPPVASMERILWDRAISGIGVLREFSVITTGSLLHLFYVGRYVTTLQCDMVHQMGSAVKAELLDAVELATRKP